MVLDCEQLPSSVGIPVSVTMAAAAGALRGAEDLGLSLAELSGRSNPHKATHISLHVRHRTVRRSLGVSKCLRRHRQRQLLSGRWHIYESPIHSQFLPYQREMANRQNHDHWTCCSRLKC